MSLQTNEDCPVCWRSFSTHLIPFTIPCGHSLCSECSTDLSRCPLCRKKLIPGYSRVRNFSLISLLDKICTIKIELKDQQIQTENSTSIRKAKKHPLSLEATAADMMKKPLNLKFHKDPLGNIRRFEIKFK